jgi:hypothetical protein
MHGTGIKMTQIQVYSKQRPLLQSGLVFMFHALQHIELPCGGTLIKKVAKLFYHKTAVMGYIDYNSAFW